LIVLCFVGTKKNVADVLTKPLPHSSFSDHEYKLQYGFEIPVEMYVEEFTSFGALELGDVFEVFGDMNSFYHEFDDILCDSFIDDVDVSVED
jgi:hypothetical protein